MGPSPRELSHAVIVGDRPEPRARAVRGAVAEPLRDFLFLLPRPTGWHEIFLAFPRRLTQRLAHRRGVAAGAD